MLGVVVVATGVTALVARHVYQRPATTEPPVVVSTSQPTLPPAQEPGSATVAVSPDAANSPEVGQVRQLAQQYFDAINTRNYDEWTSVVTPALADEQPRERFKQGYASTRDGSIEIVRIDETPDGAGLRVLLTFHSVQKVEDAPQNAPFTCVAWQVVWPVVDQGGTLRTDVSSSLGDRTVPLRQKCA